MNVAKLYDRIAVEMHMAGNESRESIIGAMTAYCLALKSDGKTVPLWTERGLLNGVHSRLDSLRGVKHPVREE
jgi:hypothetical protein